MPDVFNRNVDGFGGSFSADSAEFFFLAATGSEAGVGLLIQNVTVSYQQQVTRIYELGSSLHFYVIGRTNGQLGMARVLGPRPLMTAFYRKYGDGCQAATNNFLLRFTSDCQGNPQDALVEVKYSVINSIGFTMGAQDAVINEQVQMLYAQLNVDAGGE